MAVVAALASMRLGVADASWGDVLGAVVRAEDGDVTALVLREIRFPRVLAGLVVGAALGVAGAVMQAVTRNPLAGPGIAGLNAGAEFALVAVYVAVPGLMSVVGPLIAMSGAALATIAVVVLGGLVGGGLSPARLALAGTTLSALLTGWSAVLAVRFDATTELYWYLAGGLVGTDWADVGLLAPAVLAGLAVAGGLARSLAVIRLGDDTATSLGLSVGAVKVTAAVAVVLLVGSSVHVAGPVSFVGLIGAHVARIMIGADERLVVPASALVGAILVTVADLAARTINPPFETPIGVVTAAVGAPVFIYLIRRHLPLTTGFATTFVTTTNRLRPHTLAAFAILGLGGIVLASVVIGASSVSPSDAIAALVGESTDRADFVVWTLRAPRIAVAALVGAGLAVAGTLLQAVTRNGLADPGLLGINAGAGIGVMILLGMSHDRVPVTPYAFPIAAFAGGAIAATLVYTLARRVDQVDPLRLLLVGVAAGLGLNGLSLIVAARLDDGVFRTVTLWQAGTLTGRGWTAFTAAAPWVIAGLAVAFMAHRTLDVMMLGDEPASTLGISVEPQRRLMVATAVVLACASVSVAGGIAFVGLIAPHLARRVCGPLHRHLLPTAAVVGAIVVVAGDTIARTVVAPVELPAGIIVALLGAPYFLYLLHRTRT